MPGAFQVCCNKPLRSRLLEVSQGLNRLPSQRVILCASSKTIHENEQVLALKKWLKLRGASGIDNVICVDQPSSERGLAAVQDFLSGETVFCLPLECTVCDWHDDDGDHMEQPSSVRLAAKVLRLFADAGMSSPVDDAGLPAPSAESLQSSDQAGWGPYLRTLPRHLPAMLLTFHDPTDLRWLEYPPLERAVLSYRALAVRHYERCGGAQGLGGASLGQFTWALAIVGSRCLGASLLLLALLAGHSSSSSSHNSGTSSRAADRTAAAATAPRTEGVHLAGASAAAAAAAPTADLPSTNNPHLMMTLLHMASLSWTSYNAAPVDGSAADGSGSNDGYTDGDAMDGNGGSGDGRGVPVGERVACRPLGLAPRTSGAKMLRRGNGRSAVTSGQLRMLVPLLDLINHAQDAQQRHGRTSDGCITPMHVVPEANVRWELRPPMERQHGNSADDESSGGSSGSGWRIAIVAATDLRAGQDLLLCYDAAASNDAFALHYGFVPFRNRYDDVQLYDNLAEALTWHREEVLADSAATAATAAAATAAGCTPSEPSLAPLLESLGADELAAWYDSAAVAAAAVSRPQGDDAPLKLGAGGRLCPRLEAAFRFLARDPSTLQGSCGDGDGDGDATEAAACTAPGGDAPQPPRGRCAVEPAGGSGEPHPHHHRCDVEAREGRRVAAAVVRRCMQLLRLRAPLLADLAAIVQDERQRQRRGPHEQAIQQQEQQQDRQQHHDSHLEGQQAAGVCRTVQPRPRAAFPVSAMTADEDVPVASASAATAAPAATVGAEQSVAAGCSSGVPTWQDWVVGEGGWPGQGQVGRRCGDSGAGGTAWLAELRRYARAVSPLSTDLQSVAGLALPNVLAALGVRVGRCSGPVAPAAAGQRGGGHAVALDPPQTLTLQQRLALEYRVQKKMLLWDFVLEATDTAASGTAL